MAQRLDDAMTDVIVQLKAITEHVCGRDAPMALHIVFGSNDLQIGQ